MHTITMPKLGATEASGTVTRWLKQEGKQVDRGETLVEVETEKVNIEIGAEVSGVLRKILIPEGEPVQSGSSLALVGSIDEPLPAITPTLSPPSAIAGEEEFPPLGTVLKSLMHMPLLPGVVLAILVAIGCAIVLPPRHLSVLERWGWILAITAVDGIDVLLLALAKAMGRAAELLAFGLLCFLLALGALLFSAAVDVPLGTLSPHSTDWQMIFGITLLLCILHCTWIVAGALGILIKRAQGHRLHLHSGRS